MEKYSLEPRTVRCPACLEKRCSLLYTVDSRAATQHYVLREVAPERHEALRLHIERLWGQPTCDVVRCMDCGFCFADPFVAGDARFYDLAYERSSYPSWKWEFERTLNTLGELRREGKLDNFKLLEIGAGDGAFIKCIAPSLIPRQNVLTTEYSTYGKKTILRYGVECRSQDIRAFPRHQYAGRFDVICMFQVLEHLDRLDALFESINQFSTSGGHLFIAVPNARRIDFNELHGSLLDLPPNHTGRWTRRSFEVFAQRHGWRVVTHEIESEKPGNKLTRHIAYRYMRKRQDHGSLANYVEQVSGRIARRVLQASTAALYAVVALPEIYTLIKAPMLGDAQWVHLQKHSTR